MLYLSPSSFSNKKGDTTLLYRLFKRYVVAYSTLYTGYRMYSGSAYGEFL